MFSSKSGAGHRLVLIVVAVAVALIFCIIVLRKRQNRPRTAHKITLARAKNATLPAITPTVIAKPEPTLTTNTHILSPNRVTTQPHKASMKRRLILQGTVLLQNSSPATDSIVILEKPKSLSNHQISYKEIVDQTLVDLKAHYHLSVPDNNIFYLSARKDGCAKTTIVITDNDTEKWLSKRSWARKLTRDLVLLPAAHIRGKVVNKDNKAVSGVKISAVPLLKENGHPDFAEFRGTMSDKQGSFDLDNLSRGKFALNAGSPDYLPLTQILIAPADNVILHLSSGGALLGGHIFRKSSGEGVSHASVELGFYSSPSALLFGIPPYKTETDIAGEYRFEHLLPGKYMLSASKAPLYLLPPKKGDLHKFTLAENEIKTDYDLYLYSGHTIRGKVTDKETGKPLDGVSVSLGKVTPNKKTNEYTTDADGKYVLTGVFGPWVYMNVHKEGYRIIRPNFRDQIQIKMDPEQLEIEKNIEMGHTVTVSGIVKTGDGIPVTDAKVAAVTRNNYFQNQKFIPVNVEGGFKLEVAPFKPVRIKVQSPEYCTAYSQPVDVQDIPVTGVEVILEKGATVKGMVVSPNGEPIQDAKVIVSHNLWIGNSMIQNSKKSNTDANGAFMLSNLPSGEIALCAEKKGFADSRRMDIILSSGEIKTGLKLVLLKSHYLAGKVTDAKSKPIKSASVEVRASASGISSGGYTKTDASGYYRIDGLVNIPHIVSLHHPDYAGKMLTGIKVDRDDADFVLTKKGEEAKLIGNVIDENTGKPISDFSVMLSDSERGRKVAGKPGQFVIENITRNVSYNIRIKAPGYANLDGESVVIPTGKKIIERTFKMGKGGSIVGRVISREKRQPLADVHVYLKGVGESYVVNHRLPDVITTTDADGQFRFDNVATGKNTMVFMPQSPLVEVTRKIVVHQGLTADLGDVEIGGGSTIIGRVLQMPGEKGVPDTRVILDGYEKGITKINVTDTNGRFVFSAVKPGKYVIRLKQYNVVKFVKLDGIETTKVVLQIGMAKLKGQVLYEHNPALASINLIPPGGSLTPRETTTNTDGFFEVDNLTPGHWQAHISLMNNLMRGITEWVDITEGKTTEKTFVVPSGRLLGEVIDSNGKPVAGATITAQLTKATGHNPPAGYKTSYRATSDSEGKFVIQKPNPGIYNVRAYDKKAGNAIVQDVEVPIDRDSEKVILQLTATDVGTLVSVTLNLDTGEPIKNADCFIITTDGSSYRHGQKRNDKGILRIPNIPAGTYKLYIIASGFSSVQHTVKIESGMIVEVKDILYKVGGFDWKLIDTKASPLTNISCRLKPNAPNSIEGIHEGKTAPNGVWGLWGIYPGKYNISATLPDGSQVSEVIAIREGETTRKETIVK